MRCLIVDDEQLIREEMEEILKRVLPDAERTVAGSFEEALQAAQKKRFDVAFLDIELGEQDGIVLAKKLQGLQPEINLIMTTAHSKYALEALQMYVSAYLLKPVQEADVKRALIHLRNRAGTEQSTKKLEVVCFGNFDVLWEGKPILFKRAKAKELLAYLICLRGASASVGQICTVLWEEDGGKHRHYLRAIVSELRRALEQQGLACVLLHYKNVYAIDPAMVNCDYYAYLDGKLRIEPGSQIRFMDQYTWAEEYLYRFYKN